MAESFHTNLFLFPKILSGEVTLASSAVSLLGTTKAVSERFISAAMRCFSASEMSRVSRHTAAGLPPARGYSKRVRTPICAKSAVAAY